MQFDPQNPVIRLCAKGMEQEGLGNREAAATLFMQAWGLSGNDFEKLTAAHYVARHQKSVEEKLKWDQLALHYAAQVQEESIKGIFPSLYLNIAKCYEDLGNNDEARRQYEIASSLTGFLPDDGYGKMIRSGIQDGLKRILKALLSKPSA